jgi:hypothetical protein
MRPCTAFPAPRERGGLAVEARNLILELEFAFLHACDQQRIAGSCLQKRGDRTIEIAMLLDKPSEHSSRRLILSIVCVWSARTAG